MLQILQNLKFIFVLPGGPGLFFFAMQIFLENLQKNGDHTFNFPRAVVGEI